MGGHENGCSSLGEVSKKVLHQPDSGGVQSHHGFVDYNHSWVVEERCRYDQPLFHAMGIGFDQLIRPIPEAELLQKFLGFFTKETILNAVQVCRKPQEFHSRQFLIQERPVWDESDLSFGLLRFLTHGNPIDDHRTFCGSKNSPHHPEGGGLSCTIGADETKDLPL